MHPCCQSNGLTLEECVNSNLHTRATPRQEELTDLKNEELAEGTGRQAMKGDTIAAHYTGWLEDGTKFDSSLDRGEPLEFVCGVGMVIKGWDMGVVGMREGQKRRLTIPAHLGYGAYGVPGCIPPNATLIFEVELVKVY